MQYKVIPFTANISRNSNSKDVAAQLQSTIETNASEGWQYERMESVETNIAGSKGCYGVGAEPGTVTIIKVLVFSKN